MAFHHPLNARFWPVLAAFTGIGWAKEKPSSAVVFFKVSGNRYGNYKRFLSGFEVVEHGIEIDPF
jgi:hypothetical protein